MNHLRKFRLLFMLWFQSVSAVLFSHVGHIYLCEFHSRILRNLFAYTQSNHNWWYVKSSICLCSNLLAVFQCNLCIWQRRWKTQHSITSLDWLINKCVCCLFTKNLFIYVYELDVCSSDILDGNRVKKYLQKKMKRISQ